MSEQPTFIEKHGLWSDEQRRQADEIKRRLEADKLRYVRLAWGDTHGYSRAKTLTVPAFVSALQSGYNIGVATTTLDSAGARVFASFTRGGGMGLDEMTGSPNLTVVADPDNFPDAAVGARRRLDTLRRVFQRRQAVPFRAAPAAAQGAAKTRRSRLRQHHRRRDRVVPAARRRRPSERRQYRRARHPRPSDPDLAGRARLSLPFRIQHGSDAAGVRRAGRRIRDAGARPALDRERMGPRTGRVHFRAARGDGGGRQRAAVPHRDAADLPAPRLLRDLHGRPALKGYYASGWHLHQSLTDASSGANLFMPKKPDEALSPTGLSYLAGLLEYAVPSTVFATPTVNGYRRLRPNSLAPDRATWAYDHRGAMIRVLGGAGDAATRLENRVGEPAANPYLYILSQVVAGRAGIEAGLQPPAPDDAPYAAERPMLPKSLPEALDALDKEPLFRRELGDTFIDYFVKLKRTEAGRYQSSLEETGALPPSDEPSAWEQNEYFDFF